MSPSEPESIEQPSEKPHLKTSSPDLTDHQAISPSKRHVSSLRLRFEMDAKEEESAAMDNESGDREGFSSGDSESKDSNCDELNRIISPEGTIDSFKGSEVKKSYAKFDADRTSPDVTGIEIDGIIILIQIFYFVIRENFR